MSLQHFYLEEQVIAAQEAEVFPLRLAGDDAKHMRVLRMGTGEHIAVIDAAHDYFECEIVGFDAEVPLVCITCHKDAPERPQVVLLQGMAKGDKMETVIRHATELGVSSFIPLECARSVMKVDAKKAGKKTERWQAIAKSAAMQSGQPFVPQVEEPMGVSAAAKALSGATAVLVAWEEAPTTASIRAAIDKGMALNSCPDVRDAKIAVVVGPEGGLAQHEVDVFLGCNPAASLVSLGPSILRTETAGIVAPALVLYELGCLGERA